MWIYRGEHRPPFAEIPGEDAESVWDYPRPPVVRPDARRVVVRAGWHVLADTTRALRVLETASPPTFYLPSADIDLALLILTSHKSLCEWKGVARYWSLRHAVNGEPVAWDYPNLLCGFEALAGHMAFYPGRVECYLDDERVAPQPGRFYGGWVTADVTGPFKGAPGSEQW